MECTICSSFPAILRPPRNTICGACYEGIKTAMALIQHTPPASQSHYSHLPFKGDRKATTTCSNSPVINKGLLELVEWIKHMKNIECEQNERIDFLATCISSYNEHLHTDVYIKPGNDGPPIATHRAILASRSQVMKNLLDSDTDTCMASLSKDTTIPIPELTFKELQSLMHFLYTGSLPHHEYDDDIDKHVYSLSLAAHKYDIPYLQKLCDRFMLKSLTTTTALDVLEVSDMCQNNKLNEAVMGFIVNNFEEIAFSDNYQLFSSKNPHLSVLITRASLLQARSKRKTTTHSSEICHL